MKHRWPDGGGLAATFEERRRLEGRTEKDLGILAGTHTHTHGYVRGDACVCVCVCGSAYSVGVWVVGM